MQKQNNIILHYGYTSHTVYNMRYTNVRCEHVKYNTLITRQHGSTRDRIMSKNQFLNSDCPNRQPTVKLETYAVIKIE